MSVTDLASGVEHALARIGAARDALTAAGGSLDEAHELWSPMVEGSHDEVQQVPLRAEQARLGSDKVYATLNTVEQLLRGYLNSLGVTTAPDASAPAGSPLLADPGAPARPPSIGPTRRPTSTLVTEERLRAARGAGSAADQTVRRHTASGCAPTGGACGSSVVPATNISIPQPPSSRTWAYRGR